MPKTFTPINQPGPIVALVGAKTTLVNASSGSVFLTNDDIDTAMSELPTGAKNAVLNTLYSIAPGSSQALTAGTYNLSFSSKYSTSAVLIVETKP